MDEVVTLKTTNEYHLITMKNIKNKNAINHGFVVQFMTALDTIEEQHNEKKHTLPLIITGYDRFFCTGFDLKFLTQQTEKILQTTVQDFEILLARLLTFGTLTIGALNGHAFGAGFFLALCCDFRIMRSDRGFCCIPLLDRNILPSLGFLSLAKTKLEPKAIRNLLLTSDQFTHLDSKEMSIIDDFGTEKEVFEKSEILAKKYLNKIQKVWNKEHVSTVKKQLYSDAYRDLNNSKKGDLFSTISNKPKL